MINGINPETNSSGERNTSQLAAGYFIGFLAILALTVAITACDNGNGSTHTHEWEWKVTTPATCTTAGLETETCKHDPSHTNETRPITALGHNMEPTANITTEPTCEDDGEGDLACTREGCDHTVTGGTISKLSHLYPEWTAPNCTVAGNSSRTCTRTDCGHVDTRLTGFAPLEHDWHQWLPIIPPHLGIEGHAPTETEDGIELRACLRCTEFETRFAYALGTMELLYELINSNTEYRVYRYGANDGAVFIPAYYNRLPVTEIGAEVFINLAVTSVTIPTNVKTIDAAAFNNCTSLTRVTFADDSLLETIGYGAFHTCTNLESITIPAGVTSVGEIAFANWTVSQTIYILGYANQGAADAAWGAAWQQNCGAEIVYGAGR